MEYCLPEIPNVYWVSLINCKCMSCGRRFSLLLPKGDEIVKYQEVNGDGIRWLPTYGLGGYLDLMTKLLPDFKLHDEITMKMAKEFNSKLQEHIEPSINGNTFALAGYNKICIVCKSTDLQLDEEVIMTSPDIEWLKMSCDLINLKAGKKE